MSEHKHERQTGERGMAERAALYAAGAMTSMEAEAFEALVRAGNADAVEALRDMEPARAALDGHISAAVPRPEVKQGLLERIRKERQEARAQATERAARPYNVLAAHRKWEETGIPGVQVCYLMIDRESNRYTALYRLAPGAVFPEHDHTVEMHEECLVIEGDMIVGNLVLGPGDFHLGRKGSHHEPITTRNGCLVLVSNSLPKAA